MLAELVNLFTPNAGSVLETYSSSMSVAVSCMKVGCECFCTEHQSDCYEASMDRLTRFLLPPFKKTSIEECFNPNTDCQTQIKNGSQFERTDISDIVQPSNHDTDSFVESQEYGEAACTM